jgi:hypothetical protein
LRRYLSRVIHTLEAAKEVVNDAEPKHRTSVTNEERRQRQIELNRPLSALLDSWLQGDDESSEEQRRALEALMRGIDENRTERNLFTDYIPD